VRHVEVGDTDVDERSNGFEPTLLPPVVREDLAVRVVDRLLVRVRAR
jgi:hypothetical protein